MIIEYQGVKFAVELDSDDGISYISSIKIDNFELIELLDGKVVEKLEDLAHKKIMSDTGDFDGCF